MSVKLMVTAREAAEMLSVGISQVYLLATRGDIEKRYVGKGTREFRITVKSLEAYVAGLPTERVSA